MTERMHEDADSELARLARCWRLERAGTRARFAEQRRGVTLAERVARGIALRDLEVVETDAAPGGRVLLWLAARGPGEAWPEDLRIGTGDPVRLWREDPDEADAVLAVVSRRQLEARPPRLALMADPEAADRLADGGFRLDLDSPEATFDRGDRAIARFRDAKAGTPVADLRAVLFGGRAPAFQPERPPTTREAQRPSAPGAARGEPPTAWLDPGLNEPQRAAVRHALAACEVALIHGPPGTGKTRTLVEVVRQAVARGEKVLATAASNAAVDNLAGLLLLAGVPVVRLGHPARVAPALEARTLDALLQGTEAAALARRWVREAVALRHRTESRGARGTLDRSERRAGFQEARRLEQDARKHLHAAQAAILERTPVICATAAGADSALLGDVTFDRVVLDEATQATDPVALVALARARVAVLAGDPCQLPPTVIDPEAARQGLGSTVFERLEARAGPAADPVRMLMVQHRMRADLMAFPSAAMYGGRLVAAPAVAAHRLEDLPGVAADPLRPGALVLVDTAGKGWTEERSEEDPSTRNPGAAERTAAEVRRLLGRGLDPAAAAVITPYDAQVRLLRALLAAERALGLEVGTVDAFQGREKEAVVVDLVRSNDAGELGFLLDVRRMNVALTRARRFLLVVADSATVGGHAFYAAFLEAVEKHGTWVSAWTDDAPAFDPAPDEG